MNNSEISKPLKISRRSVIGLEESTKSKFYAIPSLDESLAYVIHPLLDERLIECSEAFSDYGTDPQKTFLAAMIAN